MSIEAHDLIKIDTEAFTEAIKNDFGLDITEVEKNTQGFSSQVYKATLDGKTIFIRTNNNPRIFPAEILGYKIFKEQGIPVPDVIDHKEHPPTIGHPTMIMNSADGIQLSKANLSPEKENIIYEDIGKILKTIHETRLEGYGPVKADGEKLKGTFSSWRENWDSRKNHFNEGLEYLKANSLLTEEEIKKLSEVYEEVSSLDFGQASLLHKDLGGMHVFVKDDKISGIIDLGALMAGDPRYDIAMSLVYQNPRQQEFFKSGYGELSNDPIVLKYLLVISAIKIAFRSRNGSKDGAERARLVFKKTFAKVYNK